MSTAHQDLFAELGATNASPSHLALGTLNFGTSIGRDAAFALLDAFADAGGRLVDTAHVYGDWHPDADRSASERMIGAWIAARGGSGPLIVTTKIGHPALDDPSTSRLDPDALRTDVAEAIDNLGSMPLPLVYLHRDDARVPVEELTAPLERLREEGLIGAYGASNWSTARLVASRRAAADRGWSGFVANQPGWGLARRRPDTVSAGMVSMDAEMVAFHAETKLPVSPYSAQSKGYFERWSRGSDDDVVRQYDDEGNRRIAARLDALSRSSGFTPTELSLAVLLASPFPVFPVVGAGDPDRLRSSFRATSIALDDDVVSELVGSA